MTESHAEDKWRRQFDALRQVSLELVSETDVEKLLATILHHAIDLLAGDDGVFFQYRPDLDCLEWQVSVASDPPFHDLFLHRGEGLAGRAWESGQICQVADYNNWEGRSFPFTVFPNRSIIAAPLAWRDEFLGVLTVGVCRHHTFSADDETALGFFAAQAAVAIHNARIHAQSQRRVRELTVIHETTRSLSQLRLPAALAQEIIRILGTVVEYDYGAVLTIDRQNGMLLPFALSEPGQRPGFTEQDRASLLSRGIRLGHGIPGWVAQHGESVRLGNVHTDPRYPSLRTDIRSALCAPLLVDGRVMGVIDTETTRPDAYSAADQQLLETVAAQIAIAIQNAQLLAREQAAGQESRNLAAYLQTALENERTRISRLIHDNFGQALTALKFDLFWLRRQLSGMQTIDDKIGEMTGLIDRTIVQVRQLSSELRPGLLDDLGLPAALEWLGEDFARRTEIEVQVTCPDDLPDVPAELATALYRICQEALTNVARHSGASRLQIVLSRTRREWLLDICDNGRGIDANVESDAGSLGLIGMRERIFPFGGTIAFVGRPGQGTMVRVRVPLVTAEGSVR